MKHCLSCTAPLPQFQGKSDVHCKVCTDENGDLRPRQEVQQAIAQWFKSWQPGITDKQAMSRASNFMKAMPAWADD